MLSLTGAGGGMYFMNITLQRGEGKKKRENPASQPQNLW